MHEWAIEYTNNANSERGDCTEILFLGDVALAGRVGDVIQQHGSQFLFQHVPPDFFDADIVCYNLECCLSTRGAAWEPKPIPFRGAPSFLSVFPRGRSQYIANVANNHFLDYGEDAAIDTLEALRAYGMLSIGATGTAADGQHVIIETRSGNVGLIAFAPSVHPLPDTSRVNLATMGISEMASQVSSLKQQADVVIASLHQGVEHTHYVGRSCRRLTHRLVDAGADCIICHHPHIIQGIETYNGVHIFHSIGNFAIGLDFQRRSYARESLALKVLLCNEKLHKIIIEPFVITDSLQQRPATWQEKQRIRAETEALSSIFESTLRANVNYLGCRFVKIHDRLSGLYEMIRRQGLPTTMKYYSGRIMAKSERKR